MKGWSEGVGGWQRGYEGAAAEVRGWEGDSKGTHEGAIKEVKVTVTK